MPLQYHDLTPPLRPFALDHAGKNNTTHGLATGAGSFVARRYASSSYADPAALDYEERLLTSLARRGLSFVLPVPLPTVRGARHAGAGAERGALIPLLPGTPLAHLPFDGTILGSALGELQIAMRDELPIPRPGSALFKDIFAFSITQGQPLQPTLADLGTPETVEGQSLLWWWDEERTNLQAFAETTYRALPMQLCHNDVTPNNLLVTNGRVTAVLDFEFATSLRLAIRHWLPGESWATDRAVLPWLGTLGNADRR